jgi:hypothetical protein
MSFWEDSGYTSAQVPTLSDRFNDDSDSVFRGWGTRALPPLNHGMQPKVDDEPQPPGRPLMPKEDLYKLM